MRYSLALFYGFADEKGYLALQYVRVKYLPNLNKNNYNIIYSFDYFGVKVLRSDIQLDVSVVEDEVILNNNENFNISKTAAAQHLKMRAVKYCQESYMYSKEKR